MRLSSGRSAETVAREWWEANRPPSLDVAVFHHGEMVQHASFGNGGAQVMYQTASLGKHFTAALALLLGLDLAAPLEISANWPGITLRHLLSHTAGIPSSGYDSLDFAREYTDEEILNAIGPLEFPPGTAWRYSNAGYVLAGIAIGRSADAFYGDLLRDRIFEPLGMTTATVNQPGGPVGYIREGEVWTPAEYVAPTLNRLADGGLCLSVRDFACWEAALSGEWGKQVAPIFQETQLTGGAGCGYGLGWSLSVTDRGRVAEHDGGWQGFSTAMARYLDEGVSTLVLANGADLDATSLAHALAS